MVQMPGNVARPEFAIKNDEMMNKTNAGRRALALSLLNEPSLVKVYEGTGTQGERDHMVRHFFGGQRRYEDGKMGAYWPDDRWGYLGNKVEIMRHGLLEAIRVAQGLDRGQMTPEGVGSYIANDAEVPLKPVETLWICAGSHFEVVIHEGDYQVTMLLLTPSMPDIPDAEKADLEVIGKIWTVGLCYELEHHKEYYKKGAPNIPELEDVPEVLGREDESKLIKVINKRGEGKLGSAT
jgi:hypothetical protein